MNNEPRADTPKEKGGLERRIGILFLTLGPSLHGPFPKHSPLLIKGLVDLGCRVSRSTWGRHAENENLFEKLFGRLEDVGKALVALVRMQPDIMYVATTLDEHALTRDTFLLLATCWSKVRKVLKMHGGKTDPLMEPGHNLYKFLTRLVIRLSDAVLLLSTEELEIWKSFERRGRYYRVDNPFIPNDATKSDSLARTPAPDNSVPTLLFAGRLIRTKGIFDLLEAMPLILKQVNCRLLIAGDGEEEQAIKQHLEKANVQQSVCLMGYLHSEELWDAYRAATVFVLPTYFYEGFPTVLSEAMSFGLPIVTTPVRGVRDHLRDGVNALFVEPKDPFGITEAVMRLLSDPKLCLLMHNANLEKVREFRPEIVVPKYVEIFSELIRMG